MKKISALIFFMLMHFGCALSAAELPIVSNELPVPSSGAAQIIFLKPGAALFGRVPVQLFELGYSDRRLIGVMVTKTKIVTDVAPGKHRFMARTNETAQFMEGEFEAGKRYYVLVRFVYGLGFQLRPIKSNSPDDYSPRNPEFRNWIAETSVVTKTPAMDKNYKKQIKYVDRAQAKFWPFWLDKTPEERAELSFRKEDFLD